MIFVSSLEIINVVLPNPNIFQWINVFVANTAAVNPNRIKTIRASDLSTFPTKGKLGFSNGPASLIRNPSDCPVLCSWVFDDFKLAEELFVKASQIFET